MIFLGNGHRRGLRDHDKHARAIYLALVIVYYPAAGIDHLVDDDAAQVRKCNARKHGDSVLVESGRQDLDDCGQLRKESPGWVLSTCRQF